MLKSLQTAIQLVDFSIEYCHIYTNQSFSNENFASIQELERIKQRILPDGTCQLVIMVDDYSPRVSDVFDYASFINRLDQKNAMPSVLINESDLLSQNETVIGWIKDNKLRKRLTRYIKKTGRHPCSLFIASWYLMRLGWLIPIGGITPAKKLVNILPSRFKEHEGLAREIIASIAGDVVFQIEDIFLDVEIQKDNVWDEFDPEAYIFDNYSTVFPHDLYSLALLTTLYKQKQHIGKVLEIGCGPNLLPVLAAIPYADSIRIIDPGSQNIEYLYRQLFDIDPVWKPAMTVIRAIDPSLSLNHFDFQLAYQQKISFDAGSVFDLPKNFFDVASMHYVAESITSDYAEFERACLSFKQSVKPGGMLIASFMENSTGYTVNGVDFPACPITISDLKDVFKDCDPVIERLSSDLTPMRSGYTGILFLVGKVQNGT
jgi:hypothetical protein